VAALTRVATMKSRKKSRGLMYSPHKFADRIGNIGTPLPDPYKSFAFAKAAFRRGAVSMIAGTPGSFKSVLALNMTSIWASQGMTVLYFCADSEEFTVTKRLSGIITGESLDLIERRIVGGELEHYGQVLGDAMRGRVEFEYEQMTGIEDIALHVKSYEAVYGGYPDVIFLDNLIDYVSNPMAWDEMQELIGNLDALAKQVKSHVCILHHAKLKDESQVKKDDQRPSGYPPADWEIQGKLTQKPRLILTIAAASMAVKVAVVKNSLGTQTRDASTTYDFSVFSSMQMHDRYRA
jgi:hypothetical protein